MGTYRKEWDCCGSVTETQAWEPETCPFCVSAQDVAAQAGDEPMDYAEQLRAAVETVCEGWTLPPGARKTLEAALWAPKVSPRATADVERAPVTPALRRAVDMTRADLGESGSNYPFVRELLAFAEAHIVTTKPGA